MTVYSGFVSSSHRLSAVVFRRLLYVCNGWDRPRVYDGISSTDNQAGIAGPSTSWSPSPSNVAGSNTSGTVKRFRYRYKNSRTGYVSDPSGFSSETVGASGGLRFTVTAPGGGGDLITSTDAKVDRIVLEATTSELGLFYKAAEVPNAAGNCDFTLSDDALAEAGFLWPDGFAANGQPPFFRAAIVHKNRLIGFGAVEHSDGTATALFGSTSVTGTGSNWTEAVAGRYLQFDGSDAAYEIASYGSATGLTLTKAFEEINTTGAYRIFDPRGRVYFSQAGYPESWGTFDFFVGLEEEPVKAVARFGSGLIVFGSRTANRMVWTDTPADGYMRPMLGQRGALHERVIVAQGAALYVMDRSGFYQFNGEAAQHLSSPIDPDLDQITWAQAEKFHGVYYPDLRVIRWYVSRDDDPWGSTEPSYYYEFDLDARTWATGRCDVPVTASALVPRSTGLQVMVADGQGYTWWDNEGVTLGLATESQGTVTAGAGATTTVIPIAETVDTSGRGVAGVSFVKADGSDAGIVASNTANEITLVAALDAAPAAGDVFHLGRVPAKLKSKVFRFDRQLQVQAKPLWLHLYLEPQSNAGELLVRAYQDFGSSAMTWPGAKYSSGRLAREGVTPPATSSATDWTVDLAACGPVVRVPLGQDTLRAIQIELEVRKTGSRVRLYGYEIVFADPKAVVA